MWDVLWEAGRPRAEPSPELSLSPTNPAVLPGPDPPPRAMDAGPVFTGTPHLGRRQLKGYWPAVRDADRLRGDLISHIY